MGKFKNSMPSGRKSRSGISTAMPNRDFDIMEDFARTGKFNTDVRRWASGVTQELSASVQRLTGKQRHFFFKRMRKYKAVMKAEKLRPDQLKDNIKKRTRKNGYMGQITRIGFRFPAHGIFIHHGVSRGHPAGNPREKIDWFNPVLLKHEKELADIAAEYYADAVVNASRMLIK